jgi:Ca2+-binding RTX toxin-like protein
VIDNNVSGLTLDSIYAEMVRLAHEAYDNATADQRSRGWRAADIDLGAGPYPTSLGYSFDNGLYRATDLDDSYLVSPIVGEVSEADATVFSGVIDGQKTLAISFRGTDQVADIDDYPDFSNHYAKFRPLIDGLKVYLANHEVDQILVSGHSLGAGMVQYLLSEFKGDHRFIGITDGSPGSDTGTPDNRIVNFVHSDDPIATLSELGSSTLGKAVIAALAAATVALAPGGGVQLATAVTQILLDLKQKVREGSNVTIDSSVHAALVSLATLSSPDTIFDEHKSALYASTVFKLIGFAGDAASPFARTALAQALRAGTDYTGKDLQVGVGKALNPDDPFSGFSTVFQGPMPEDDFVLGGGGRDCFFLEKGGFFDSGSLLAAAKVDRVFDGGEKWDVVFLPGGRSEYRMVDVADGGTRLLSNGKLVGTFFRTEGFLYADGSIDLPGGGTPVVQRPSGGSIFEITGKADYADAGDGAMTVIGSDQSDIILLGSGAKTVNAKEGDDIVRSKTGETGATIVNGGAGDDILITGKGNDLLDGGPGSDTLRGGKGHDKYLFDAAFIGAVDAILGFKPSADVMRLDHDIFSGLALGALAKSAFAFGNVATEANDRILYFRSTGALLFDPDGKGGEAAVVFAIVDDRIGISHADFFVI